MTRYRAEIGRALVLGLAATLFTACGGGGEEAPRIPSVTFDTAGAWIRGDGDSVPLLVELARSDEERSFGLMLRDSLDWSSGMIFLYDEPQSGDSYFWMYRTRIPLDIAFIDQAGVIDTILSMEPCEAELYPQQSCERYAPGTEYVSALEVNRGWFDEHGIEPGDTVVVDFGGDGAGPEPADDYREVRLSVGHAPSDVAGADLDGDGHTDLVVAHAEGLTVFLGDGAGGFRRGSTTDAGENPTGLASGDFDGDGRVDILTANHETSYVTLLFGGPEGELEARPGSRIEVEVSPHTHAVAAGDVNEDGRLDFLVDDRNDHALDLFLGRGDGTFREATPAEVDGDPYRGMYLGDLNGDGHLDLATPNPREIAVLLGDGTGGFDPAPGAPHPAPSPFSVTAADLNGDGIQDLAAASGEGRDEVAVLLGEGDGAFRPAPSTPLRAARGAKTVTACDLNDDGFGDLVIAAYVANRVIIVFGGEDDFTSSEIAVEENPWGVGTGDLDGDGRCDFATANQGSDDLSVFLSGAK